MSYTWRDIKLATLQKMYAAEGSEIIQDASTQDYLAGMPYAANEGLMRLSTAGKFIVKSIVLNHMPSKNLVSKNDNQIYSADGAKSYYFQYSGIGTATITTDDGSVVLDLDAYGTFKEYKGNIVNTTNGKVTISFASNYPSTIKNLALYADAFPTDADVPKYGDYVTYDLRELVDDFYSLFDNSICYRGGEKDIYLSTSDYYRESDHLLVLPKEKSGMYTIYYNAYPGQITITTDDDYVMTVDPEIIVLLPLYMASQLFKDDDPGIATTLRNEFEVGLDSLVNTSRHSGKEYFTSEWV